MEHAGGQGHTCSCDRIATTKINIHVNSLLFSGLYCKKRAGVQLNTQEEIRREYTGCPGRLRGSKPRVRAVSNVHLSVNVAVYCGFTY